MKPFLQDVALECPPIPDGVPLPHDDWRFGTPLSLSILEGPALNLWSSVPVVEDRAQSELEVQLQPQESLVIGRQEGGQIEYLDARYHPTRMLPNSTRPVVTSLRSLADRGVSRGHFMLTGSTQGIVLLNGVPRRDGGIRPPLNGTRMEEPEQRMMNDAEEYLIARGASAKIRLPNGTLILLRAD
jgi:hypothetical protein